MSLPTSSKQDVDPSLTSFRFPLLPTRPQCPCNQQWLKEQADKALGVGIESEGIDVIDVLIDVARKDKNEKYSCGETNDAPVLCEN